MSLRRDQLQGLADEVTGRARRRERQAVREQERELRERPVGAYFDPYRTADH